MTLDLNMTKIIIHCITVLKLFIKMKIFLVFIKGFSITGSTYPFIGIQFSIYRYFEKIMVIFGAPIAGFIAQTSMYQVIQLKDKCK